MTLHLLSKAALISAIAPLLLCAQDTIDSNESESPSPFHRGAYALSGSLTYTHSSIKHNNQTLTTFSMSPLYLHFASSKFAFGGQILYTSTESKNDYNLTRSSVLGVGPQFRVYVLQNPILTFCSLSAFMTSSSSEARDIKIDGPQNSMVAIDIGADIFFASHLSLEPFIEYRYVFSGDSTPSQTFVVGVSIAAFVYN